MGQRSQTVEVREDVGITLEDYASIPIAFEVTSIFDVKTTDYDLATFLLTERHLNVPYWKDYDSINGEHPSDWAKRFVLTNWIILSAWVNGWRVGGAVIAFRTPELTMLEERDDLAVLWDIRVSPEARHQGIGTALFQVVEARAHAASCQQLKIETQNINVAACRFYARQGCVLRSVNHQAYSELPDEIQLFWYKDLSC